MKIKMDDCMSQQYHWYLSFQKKHKKDMFFWVAISFPSLANSCKNILIVSEHVLILLLNQWDSKVFQPLQQLHFEQGPQRSQLQKS